MTAEFSRRRMLALSAALTGSGLLAGPRSSTTTDSELRVAISFAISRPAQPPPTITTSTGFRRVIEWEV